MPQPVTSVTGFAMTHCKGYGGSPERVVREADPYGCAARGAVRRADVGIGPYENVGVLA